METQKSDTMVVLGDAGFNYYRSVKDDGSKKFASKFPITLLCIHGNHEIRPQNIPTYKETTYHGGKVLYEEEYPDILFAVDGEVYDLDDFKCIVIGGAYSVDKYYRLDRGFGWWPDEQPSPEIRARVEAVLDQRAWQVDVVLSHTCPLRYEPVEVFISGIDQSQVDKSTETWLGQIEAKLHYKRWYCGHYHTEKKIDRLRFMFEDYALLPYNAAAEQEDGAADAGHRRNPAP